MTKLLFNELEFKEYEYTLEKDFEKDVVDNAKKIFGEKTVYINVKKLLKDKYNSNKTIPDGYLLDYTIENNPKLYFVENELVGHSVREHIADQLIKFGYNYMTNSSSIKNIVIESLMDSNIDIDSIAKNANYRNVDDMLTNILARDPLGVIVVIDEITEELNDLLKLLNVNIELLEFKKYKNGNNIVFQYDEFNDDSYVINGKTKEENIPDTILVAAEKEGFETAFLGDNCWYAVAISMNMLDKIKYIAVYQKNPIKAVTYYAEVADIRPYENTKKYIIYLKGEPIKLKKPIPIDPNNTIRTPRGRVYTNIKKIMNAKDNTTVADLY